MPNRSMKLKTERAAVQRAAIALDIHNKESYVARTAPTVMLSDIKAEYTGRVTVCPAGKYNGYQSRISKIGSGSKLGRFNGKAGEAIRVAKQAHTIMEIRAARAASATF